jgi:hypothetical protein
VITIIGGTYFEYCKDPPWEHLYGSGLRAAAALSSIGQKIELKSCIAERDLQTAQSICNTFKISGAFKIIPKTIAFHYYHPLSSPTANPDIPLQEQILLDEIKAECVLQYGMLEASVKITAIKAVYDPQNGIRFHSNGSTSKHLAMVLNRKEAYLLSDLPEKVPLRKIGQNLLRSEKAEVVVIKDGPRGALVFEGSKIYEIPVFKTSSVWPIGSGDVFSAAFAWQWMQKNKTPRDAALNASLFTAQYCETRVLPLARHPGSYEALTRKKKAKKIYLAGPFFTISERWLINEIRSLLLYFGNEVFSPMHDVGFGSPEDIATEDLKGLEQSDLVFAVIDGLDAGTLFEIGYAKSKGISIIAFSENASENDLLMLVGSGVSIITDFSTSIYMASW